MRQQFTLFYFFVFYISRISTQIVYQCNFDISTENCFIPEMNTSSNIGFPNLSPPNAPLSDVTSSLQLTDDGEMCKLFYRIDDTYTWDMYFCNGGFCPTENYPNSRCQSGYFGFVYLNDDQVKSFQVNIESNTIDRMDQQCLIYYYYMPNIGEKILNVRKEETNGESEVIDSVTNSPFNGWIQRKISFNIQKSNYKIYFEVQKTSESSALYIGFDEISIIQGECDEYLALENSTATDMTLSSSSTPLTSITTTSIVVETSSSTTIPVPSDTSSPTTPESEDTSSSTTLPVTEDTSSSTTTPIEVDTSTSETQETSSTTTTPIEVDTSTSEAQSTFSSETTPVSSESSSSTIIPTSIETTYSDETTSTETTDLSTMSSSISTTSIISTDTTSMEIETTESTSQIISSTNTDTTTTTPISTDVTDIPSNTSNTTTDTIPTITTTSIISTTTTPKDINVIIASYEEILPYETHEIVIMAVIIPLLWITVIVAFFRAKKSKNIIGSLLHPFNSFSRGGKTWGSYELETVSDP